MGEVISVGANVVTALAAVFVAWVAYRGVDTWRRQLIGHGRFAVAKRLLTRVFELEIIVKRIREPIALGYVDLWEPLNSKQKNLAFIFCEARVVWGKELPDTEAKLARTIHRLARSRHYEQEAQKDGTSEEMRERILRDHVSGVRWSGDPDEFGKALHTAVEELEAFLRPYMSH